MPKKANLVRKKLLKATQEAKHELNMTLTKQQVDKPNKDQDNDHDFTWTKVIRRKNTDFKCEMCDETFSTKQSMEKHSVKHKEKEKTSTQKAPYNEVLKKSTPNESKENERQKQNESFTCTKCEKTCESKDQIRRHTYTKHESINCYLCDERVESRAELINHKKVKHNITKIKICKFYLEDRCYNNNECLYSHTKPNDNEEIEINIEPKPTKNVRVRRQIVCKNGKRCDRECNIPEEGHMNISDVHCHFQENCKKVNCPFKHNCARKTFLEIGHKPNTKT